MRQVFPRMPQLLTKKMPKLTLMNRMAKLMLERRIPKSKLMKNPRSRRKIVTSSLSMRKTKKAILATSLTMKKTKKAILLTKIISTKDTIKYFKLSLYLPQLENWNAILHAWRPTLWTLRSAATLRLSQMRSLLLKMLELFRNQIPESTLKKLMPKLTLLKRTKRERKSLLEKILLK